MLPSAGSASDGVFQPPVTHVIESSGERLENEQIFELPFGKAESLWEFLKEHFRSPFEADGKTYMTSEAIEIFEDRYFDTPARDLLRVWGGLRIRNRLLEDGSIKRLIQLKQSPEYLQGGHVQTRSEVKFVPMTEEEASTNTDRHELLKYLDSADRSRLASLLNPQGADVRSLEPLIRITQERRRIYFQDQGMRFFTVTLDRSTGSYMWLRSHSVSFDLEIGEKAFTGADEEKRKEYLAFQKMIRSVILDAFPEAVEDQEPKVVKMHRLLLERGAVSRAVVLIGGERLLRFGVVISIGFLLVLGWCRKLRGISPAAVWGGIT